MEEHSVPAYKWRRFFQIFLVCNGLSPYEASVSTLCRASPRQWLDLSPMIPSPMKCVECLYYDVSPPLILLVQSCFIEFTCHIQFIQSYIHVFVHSYIHAYTAYTQHQSYMIA